MGIHAIQPSFSGGEFAPSLFSRVDLSKYAIGLRKAKNIFIHPHGGASNRSGLRHIAVAKDSTRRVRVVPFEFSTEQAYVIEFGHLYCRFYRNSGQILVGAGPAIFEIATPYTEDDIFDMKFAQSADVLYIASGVHAPRELTRTDHDAWTLSLHGFVKGPFMLSNDTIGETLHFFEDAWVTATSYVAGDSIVESGNRYTAVFAHTSGTFSTDFAAGAWFLTPNIMKGSGTVQSTIVSPFTEKHVGSIWKMVHRIPSQQISGVVQNAALNLPVIACGPTWRLITKGDWSGTISVEKSITGGIGWESIATFTDDNVDTFGETGEEQCLLRIIIAAGTNYFQFGGPPPSFTGAATATLSSEGFTWISIFKVDSFLTAFAVRVTFQQPSIGGFQTTIDWSEGSWSSEAGYPQTVVFFQNRLWWGATDKEPQTGWGTQIGLYENHGRSRPLIDSDAISFLLPSQKVNIIRNMIALNEIVAFTSDDDWEIGSDSGVITPTTIRTRPRGFRGSAKPSPAIVGSRAIVIQPIGSIVRDVFSNELEGFQGGNISIISNHLFQGFSVIEMAYSQEPDSLLWLVRSDGKLLSLTYLVEQEVLAWTRHETAGEFESVCTIPGDQYDETWFVVKRGSDRFIEQMQKRLPNTNPQDQFFVDSGLSLDIPKAITGATQTNPVVISSAAHGFVTGDLIDIRLGTKKITNENETNEVTTFTGMGELNDKRFKVKNETGGTYEITDEQDNDIDGTAFSAFDKDGEARKAETVISGLGHLEGVSVACLANGNVQPPKIVSGGSITLDRPASVVHIGRAYESELETLNIEIGLRDGTMQGRKVKIDELTVRLLNSRGLRAGTSDGRSLDELTRRDGEPLGAAMELFSGDALISFQGGYEDAGRVLIRQSNPLPMTVIALIPRFTPGSR